MMKIMVTGVGNIFVPRKKMFEPLGLSYCIIGGLPSLNQLSNLSIIGSQGGGYENGNTFHN